MNRLIDPSQKPIKSQIVQSKHSKPISNTIFIKDTNLLITLGEDGELNLYKQQSNKYSHIRTVKIFSSPIISFDIIKEWSDWKICLLSFTSELALCRLNFSGHVTIFNRSKIVTQQASQLVTSCCWSSKRNEVLFTTSFGKIFIDQPTLNLQYVELNQKVNGAKLVRSGSHIYVSAENQIFEVVFLEDIKLQNVVQATVFKEKVRILDFLVSYGEYMNFIIILTEQKLFFFLLQQLSAKPQIIELPVKTVTGKLSWERQFNTIGVNLPFKQGTKIYHYSNSLSGNWSQQPQYQ